MLPNAQRIHPGLLAAVACAAVSRFDELMRALLVISTMTFGCVGMSVPTTTGTQSLSGDLEKEVNRLGGDYRSFELTADDPELCRAACDDDVRCRAFTYVKPGLQGPAAKCWLKETVPASRAEGCCVSGVKQ